MKTTTTTTNKMADERAVLLAPVSQGSNNNNDSGNRRGNHASQFDLSGDYDSWIMNKSHDDFGAVLKTMAQHQQYQYQPEQRQSTTACCSDWMSNCFALFTFKRHDNFRRSHSNNTDGTSQNHRWTRIWEILFDRRDEGAVRWWQLQFLFVLPGSFSSHILIVSAFFPCYSMLFR